MASTKYSPRLYHWTRKHTCHRPQTRAHFRRSQCAARPSPSTLLLSTQRLAAVISVYDPFCGPLVSCTGLGRKGIFDPNGVLSGPDESDVLGTLRALGSTASLHGRTSPPLFTSPATTASCMGSLESSCGRDCASLALAHSIKSAFSSSHSLIQSSRSFASFAKDMFCVMVSLTCVGVKL